MRLQWNHSFILYFLKLNLQLIRIHKLILKKKVKYRKGCFTGYPSTYIHIKVTFSLLNMETISHPRLAYKNQGAAFQHFSFMRALNFWCMIDNTINVIIISDSSISWLSSMPLIFFIRSNIALLPLSDNCFLAFVNLV